jgi:hypothetical protein
MGLRKNVFFRALIIILAIALPVFIFYEYNYYAVIQYGLLSPTYVAPNNALQVSVYLQNVGSADAVPIFTLQVVNATIQKVSIPSIADNKLSSFCHFNNETATIDDITASAGNSSDLWAFVYVIPNNNTSAFSVYSNVKIPFDFLHIRNEVSPTLTNKVSYNLSSSHLFNKSLS